jgi:ribosomal protein S3
MGQKVMPIGLRLGITENWRSRWYAGKDYAKTLEGDLKVRAYLTKRLKRAALSKIDIERKGDKTIVELWTARPGIVIGKKGAEVDVLRKELEKITGGTVAVNIVEIKRPELDAVLIAQSVAEQLEGRVAFRRAMRARRLPRPPRAVPWVFGSSARVASAAPRWVVASGTARVACRFTPCARRSTTVPRPPARRWAPAV